MADLIAQGTQAEHRWRRPLPVGERIVLGRSAGQWAAPWDMHISRRHAFLVWNGRRLQVQKLPEARNPIFFHGRAVQQCELAPDDHFVIGHTSFTLVEQAWTLAEDLPKPSYELQYSSQDLAAVRFRNPDYRIEVLSRLPEVLSGAATEEDLSVRLVSMLLAGVPRAEAAAMVLFADRAALTESSPGQKEQGVSGSPDAGLPSATEGGGQDDWIRAMYWDQRLASSVPFRPSRRLIREALLRRRSVLHVWRRGASDSERLFTDTGQYDWAFCTPILPEGLSPWAIYLAGRFSSAAFSGEESPPIELGEDMKFTELAASMVGSLRRMRRLERQQAILSQFFSPLVLKSLGGEDPDRLLGPQEADVSVLFCDLRGFSRESERGAENLKELLGRVSEALGVMTRHILDQGGVVGDYQGDAALGFWGWPVSWEDRVERTCRAALAIRAQFQAAAKNPESPLAGFQVGIGIASGRAVAGKIGAPEQAKVTVFGPVVNLASRLESMTKIFHAPILVDQATAEAVRRHTSSRAARVRRVAVVRPYGMENPLEIAELLPPPEQDPLLSDEQIALYEAGLDAFLAGRWQEAYQYFHQLPAEDQVADFLIAYIVQHNRTPPPQWDGVIPLHSK